MQEHASPWTPCLFLCGSLRQCVILWTRVCGCEREFTCVHPLLCVWASMCVWKTTATVGVLAVGWVKRRGQLSLWNMLVLISVMRSNRVMNQHKARDSPEWTAASSSNTCTPYFDYTYCLCKHLLPSTVVYGRFSKVPELWLLSGVYSHMSSPAASPYTQPLWNNPGCGQIGWRVFLKRKVIGHKIESCILPITLWSPLMTSAKSLTTFIMRFISYHSERRGGSMIHSMRTNRRKVVFFNKWAVEPLPRIDEVWSMLTIGREKRLVWDLLGVQSFQ